MQLIRLNKLLYPIMEYVYLGIQKDVRNQIRSLKGSTSYSDYLRFLIAAKEEKN